jgi:3-phenylpropionate/cinnamic acid dioxygenase small subunit
MKENLYKVKEFNKDLEKQIDADILSNFINFLDEHPDYLLIPIDKNSIKKRIKNNNLYLNDLYSFFDEEKDSINEIIKLIEIFLKECSESKFHKRKQFKEDFEIFINESTFLNKTSPELGDSFLIKLMAKVYVKSIFEVSTNTIKIEYTSIDENSNIPEKEIDDIVKHDLNYENFLFKEREQPSFNIKTGYSRNHVTTEILKDLSN